MIGIAGYYKIQRGGYITEKEDIQKIEREPRLSL